MYFCTARLIRKAPRRCTFMTMSQSVSVILNSMLSRVTPALFTSTVGPPSSAATRSTAACTCSGSLTSAPTASAFPPAASMASTVPLAEDSSRSRTATANPSWANRSAVAAPMPRAAPVTMATRVPALASLMDVPFQMVDGCRLRRRAESCARYVTAGYERPSSRPDAGHDDRRHRQLHRRADQAGRVEFRGHQVRPEPAGSDQVEHQEGHRLQQDTEHPEHHRVEQRPAESAGGVGPDAGEHDRALAEKPGGDG